MGVANHRGDGADNGFRDGANNFSWKPAEVVVLLRAEGNCVISVVVDPVARPRLTIMAVADCGAGHKSPGGKNQKQETERFAVRYSFQTRLDHDRFASGQVLLEGSLLGEFSAGRMQLPPIPELWQSRAANQQRSPPYIIVISALPVINIELSDRRQPAGSDY
jgi:hypothetical protein